MEVFIRLASICHRKRHLLKTIGDMKLYNQLCNKHGENVEEKSLTICSGTDYININYQHVVCPDAATAKPKHTSGDDDMPAANIAHLDTVHKESNVRIGWLAGGAAAASRPCHQRVV
uniref:PH_14 domain-containing protein n=1 Tax=Anopheles maculatus TaxID=74869 RepID=A0A182SBY9_9DIPT